MSTCTAHVCTKSGTMERRVGDHVFTFFILHEKMQVTLDTKVIIALSLFQTY